MASTGVGGLLTELGDTEKESGRGRGCPVACGALAGYVQGEPHRTAPQVVANTVVLNCPVP